MVLCVVGVTRQGLVSINGGVKYSRALLSILVNIRLNMTAQQFLGTPSQ